MANHPEALACAFSDNLSVVGRLSKAYPAAYDVTQALRRVNLLPQPRDSACFIPSYCTHAQDPPLLQEMAQRYPDMIIPRAKDGVRILGFPVGTESFVQTSLAKIKDSIIHELPALARIDDGLIHFQMLRLCVNTRFPFSLRGVPTEASMAHAKEIDNALWEAFGAYCGFEDGFAGTDSYADAHIQFRMPIAQGGFGVTANEAKAAAAHYCAMSHAFKFVALSRYAPVSDFIRSDAFRNTPLYKGYDAARDFLIQCGAVSDDPLLPSQGDGDAKAVILPTFQALTAADPVGLRTFVPEQRDLTRLVTKALPAFSPQSLSLAGQLRTNHMGTRVFNASNKESPLVRSHNCRNKN
jgi:hypothetical protein